MKPFALYIIYVSWGSGGKSRPVLVFSLDESQVFVYPITSRYDHKSKAMKAKYFRIDDWAQAGLDRKSYVDTGTLISFPVSAVRRKKPIGALTDKDKQRLLDFLTKQ